MILVFIPYHQTKRYAIQHVLDWVDHQTHEDVEVIMRWHTGPYGEQDAVKVQLEFARCLAIERGATHLYILEADTIPPLDVLDKLLAHDKDVVGALYRYRNGEAPIVAWPKENITTGLCEIDGMGTGAVLLSRKAIESFSFLQWVDHDSDTPMYKALKAKDFKVYIDADTRCKHYADSETYY